MRLDELKPGDWFQYEEHPGVWIVAREYGSPRYLNMLMCVNVVNGHVNHYHRGTEVVPMRPGPDE